MKELQRKLCDVLLNDYIHLAHVPELRKMTLALDVETAIKLGILKGTLADQFADLIQSPCKDAMEFNNSIVEFLRGLVDPKPMTEEQLAVWRSYLPSALSTQAMPADATA